MEKSISRTFAADTLKAIVDEIFYTEGHDSIYAYIDMENNMVVLSSERKRAKSMLHLFTYQRTKAEKYTKKIMQQDAKQIRILLLSNKVNQKVCKTRLVNEFGKGVEKKTLEKLMNISFIEYKDNPYYKCAEPMAIYDADVFQWHLAKNNKKKNEKIKQL